MQSIDATPLGKEENVSGLLEIMQANNMTEAKDLISVISQVGKMEKHFADMLKEITTLRQELAQAQKQNHPIQTALQKAVISLQKQALDIRDKVSALKLDITVGCKSALAAVEQKGLSALRNVTDFIKLRPALEALQKDIDTAIRQDQAAIAKIEKASAEYHEAGRHIKNMGRAIAGKEAFGQAAPPGKLVKAFTAPIRADCACLKSMGGCVNRVIGAVGRLENTERPPPIKETLHELNKQIERERRDAPTVERSVPEHAGR